MSVPEKCAIPENRIRCIRPEPAETDPFKIAGTGREENKMTGQEIIMPVGYHTENRKFLKTLSTNGNPLIQDQLDPGGVRNLEGLLPQGTIISREKNRQFRDKDHEARKWAEIQIFQAENTDTTEMINQGPFLSKFNTHFEKKIFLFHTGL